MTAHFTRFLKVCVFVALISCPLSLALEADVRGSNLLGRLPVSFEPAAQVGAAAPAFEAKLRSVNVRVTAAGIDIRHRAKEHETLRITFVGGSRHARVEPLDLQAGTSNYFIGSDSSRWRSNVPRFGRVAIRDVYPGIDLILYVRDGALEYDAEVAPGADPRRIRLKVVGADDVSSAANADLVFRVGDVTLRQRKPIAYQVVSGRRTELGVRHKLSSSREISFDVPSYDRTQTLVIDPALIYSTYLGEIENEEGVGIAVDPAGSAYVLVVDTDGPALTSVTKIDQQGGFVYSTSFGATGGLTGYGIAVDSMGNAYVTGSAGSGMPTTAAWQAIFGGGFTDAFVTKINPSGNGLVYSTYLGGAGQDGGLAVALSANGTAYVTGYAGSGFPLRSPFQNTFGGGVSDAFVATFSPIGVLTYSTYLGGSSADRGTGIAVDSAGNMFVTGYTIADFPVINALQPTFGGVADAFITKISAAGNQLVYSTYLGGAGNDRATGIAVDGNGNAYITGTASAGFPVMSALQSSPGGAAPNAFVAKVNAQGALVYSTYLGGSTESDGNGIAVGASGNVYVTGGTGDGFPVANALQPTLHGSFDAFVTEINPQGTGFIYSTYLGGSQNEVGMGIALDSFGNTYVTGFTSSTDFPVVNALQPNSGGHDDAFISVIAGHISASVLPHSGTGTSQTFHFQVTDDGGASNINAIEGWFTPTSTSATNTCLIYYATSSHLLYLASDDVSSWSSQAVGTSGTLQNGQCSIDVASVGVVSSANTLALSVPITFNPTFGGLKQVFMFAVDSSGNSGWRVVGSWTTVPAIASAVSVTPNAGTGASQTFQFLATDTGGNADLVAVEAWITPNAFSNGQTCLIYYSPYTHVLSLASDNVLTWNSLTIGAPGVLSNSQCSIDVAGTTVTLSGNSLTLSVPITFSPAFAGPKQVYMFAQGTTANSGWKVLGNWTPASPVVKAVIVSPIGGNGTNQTFLFHASDTGGASDLVSIEGWFTPTSATAANTCLIYYATKTGLLYLASDDVSTWSSRQLGTLALLQNSQCVVDVSGATINTAANDVTLSVPLTFKAAFAGTKQIFMFANGAFANSGWVFMGNWTPVPSTATAVSATPNAGSGSSQTFQFLYSDTGGAADLNSVEAWFTASPTSTANTCLIYYDPYHLQLYLANDNGSTWSSQTIGTASTLQNSQCSLNVGGSTATANGNNLTLSVPVSFMPAFAGSKQVWIYASGTTGNSGWQNVATWTAQ